MYFHSPTQGRLSFKEAVISILNFIREEPQFHYRLIIGTDSRETDDSPPAQLFVTAIVIHRVGWGARYFWRRTRTHSLYTIRDRIYQEALLSLQISQKLMDFLDSFPDNHLSNYNVEIHVDVGNNGPTRSLIKEIVGMIEGMGFVAKVKPDSFGASRVAHRHT
ncbi:MAG TPA: ribonuclease H-like YkuK family protein [Candidatus Atribacteria bacterium]|uniref:ribonuclease H-like YkuK family protein n=1 Tax=Candidatus Sordicultor fermentans TaxID=1953203 RepID=UPI002A267259|nr:ribonuclease H-like YkuK family protein [Atribacterota bacterium]HOA99478.1 ribonuclease H-like YkuK family protein [Candidatus Atribacteria bacterium]MDI9608568.1 ribonuclease H-like YkuK family protein [Atribacterota bacterium]HOQ51408.1 ribonuclease H-like YkuK family protein [Candidatus Atribacteria bacterium]HPT64000.1 ribonuclease H-like YkuK family protein [Candidatus Atribacteria bacterium]